MAMPFKRPRVSDATELLIRMEMQVNELPKTTLKKPDKAITPHIIHDEACTLLVLASAEATPTARPDSLLPGALGTMGINLRDGHGSDGRPSTRETLTSRRPRDCRRSQGRTDKNWECEQQCLSVARASKTHQVSSG